MTDYHLYNLDLSILIDLAMQTLNPLRAWGEVTVCSVSAIAQQWPDVVQ
jgi:hypothetical protein